MFRITQNRVSRRTEHSCEVWIRIVPVDGQAEGVDPVGARLEYRLARILYRVRRKVPIDVVRLPIREDQQQTMTSRLRRELGCRVTNRGAEPGISARVDPGNTPSDRFAV